jgi:hypothetical protein
MSAALELVGSALLREPLGFGDLRGSHAFGDIFKIFFCLLLFFSLHVCGGKAYPHIRPDIVLRSSQSCEIQFREVVLPNRVTLCRGLLVPGSRLGMVLWHAPSLGIQVPEPHLRLRVPLACLCLEQLQVFMVRRRKRGSRYSGKDKHCEKDDVKDVHKWLSMACV